MECLQHFQGATKHEQHPDQEERKRSHKEGRNESQRPGYEDQYPSQPAAPDCRRITDPCFAHRHHCQLPRRMLTYPLAGLAAITSSWALTAPSAVANVAT